MSKSKHIDLVCVLAVVAATVICCLLLSSTALGMQTKTVTMGYENRLFDTSRVHTVDIVIDDWEAFLQTAQSEEYTVCDVVIDGEAFRNVGIRGKGNTSLSTVASMDSGRYSFKIEFDQYDSSSTYHGLDKLSLNNLIQDNTMMKDYLAYRLMNEFGVAAPLCSYVYITVNGEDWGLYLAVEAVEESFLQRNYGSDYGELYKPDSMNMGGGRGNGKDFDPDTMMEAPQQSSTGTKQSFAPSQMGGFDPSQMGGFDPSQMGGFDPSQMGGMGGFGMGSQETKLQYIDDDFDSYSTIFSSAKTDLTAADKSRLIAALKQLSEGDVSAVDAEAVIRYFVVHNFVVNGDSYTGSMIHNYYLYEEDGRLSMLPWDYNLAFGTFQGGSAAEAVNDAIDAPLSVTGSDRPMIDWIFRNEAYSALYRQLFGEFLDTVEIDSIITEAQALIAPYVQKDPTRFCTYEEFETGVKTLAEFCRLRSQSVAQQLAGESANVDASGLNLSAMGTMGGGFGGQGRQPGASGEGRANGTSGAQSGMQIPGGFGQLSDTQGASGNRFSGFGGQGSMTPPEGKEGLSSGQNGMTMPENRFSGQTVPGSVQDLCQWILFGVSLAVLAVGLLIAFKFRR